MPATLTTVSANLGEKIAITPPSSTRLPANSSEQHFAVADRGARRPPQRTVEIRRVGRGRIRGQHRKPRQRAVGKDRGDLERDDKAGADDGGKDLRDEARPARADQAKQQSP